MADEGVMTPTELPLVQSATSKPKPALVKAVYAAVTPSELTVTGAA
jgi:hypothetical protein